MIARLKKHIYTTADGKEFSTLLDAQTHALVEIFNPGAGVMPDDSGAIANSLIGHAPDVIKILKLKERKAKTPTTRRTKG